MECCFTSYDEFITEYKNYSFDECSNCNGSCELVETDLTCIIEGRILYFSLFLYYVVKKCGNEILPENTKQMIDGAYKTAVKEKQTIGEFHPTGYMKKFEYCTEQNYEYDHRDYFNIPGLFYDEEHSVEGFLILVYFEKEALVFFLLCQNMKWIFSRRAMAILQKKILLVCIGMTGIFHLGLILMES